MIIYKITNKQNGKTYIGQTIKTVAERLKEHIYQKSKIGKEIIKYGVDSFDVSVIDRAENKADLDALEVFWISFYNSCENGYNTLIGGKPTKSEFRFLNKIANKVRKKNKKKLCVTVKICEKPKETKTERIYKKYMQYFGDRVALPFPQNGEFSKEQLRIMKKDIANYEKHLKWIKNS